MISAIPTSTFLGSHPRRAHVPPNGLESTTATFQPAEVHSCAMADAAAPVPITIRSNCLLISNPIRLQCVAPGQPEGGTDWWLSQADQTSSRQPYADFLFPEENSITFPLCDCGIGLSLFWNFAGTQNSIMHATTASSGREDLFLWSS